MLVLDEPTNDLDIETLELLEELLLGFEGTVLLVSHDREFMDNVVTSIIVMDGLGAVDEFVGGYSDWEARGGSLLPPEEKPRKTKSSSETAVNERESAAPPDKGPKLTYEERKDLGALPARIEDLEQKHSQITAMMAEPGFYESGFEKVQEVTDKLAQAQTNLDQAYARWDELEARANI